MEDVILAFTGVWHAYPTTCALADVITAIASVLLRSLADPLVLCGAEPI
jgi:hypothetical protein